jgi:branched-chain amino acid aminotransferase
MQNPIDIGEPFFLYNSSILPTNEFHIDLLKGKCNLYEVVRVVLGKPLFFEEHFQRLANSCDQLGLQFNREETWWMLTSFLRNNFVTEKNIRIVLNFNGNKSYNLVAYFINSHYPSETDYQLGVATELLPIVRENPNVKAENLSLRRQADELIKSKGVFEVILVNSFGEITEGSRSNIFLVKGNVIFTSPLNQVLEGITRKKVVQLAYENSIECIEQPIRVEELYTFDAAFLTGTSPKVLPINRIGTVTFNGFSTTTKKIIDCYNQLITSNLSKWD